jgi:DNA helicase-2/ATP-dependent DNA helicase PcrA
VKERERRRTAADLNERHKRQADFSNNIRGVSYREVISVTQFIDAVPKVDDTHGAPPQTPDQPESRNLAGVPVQ